MATRPARTVLVVCDRSPGSTVVLERAALLRYPPGARAVLLQTREGGGPGAPEAPVLLETRAEVLRARLAPQGVRVETVLAQGAATDAIVETAAACGADLLLLGRADTHGLGDVLGGSSLERVLARVHCPVLLPHVAARAPYRQVVVALDDTGRVQRGLELLPDLVESDAAAVELLHVYDTSYSLVLHQQGVSAGRVVDFFHAQREQAERALQRQLRTQPAVHADWPLRLVTGVPEQAILEEVRTQGADLVVVGHRARTNRLAQLLTPGVARQLVRHAPSDVLVACPSEPPSARGRA